MHALYELWLVQILRDNDHNFKISSSSAIIAPISSSRISLICTLKFADMVKESHVKQGEQRPLWCLKTAIKGDSIG